jgi:hypothetical protein
VKHKEEEILRKIEVELKMEDNKTRHLREMAISKALEAEAEAPNKVEVASK